MRSTIWLAGLAIPFSYGTTILLARTSPEAVGTYGLLSAYIAFVSCILYLGGDAVAIKFIPELKNDKRMSFLVSYFLVICVALIPWFAVGTLWPNLLHYLLGKHSNSSFQMLILYMAPISILVSLIGASLKGLLEIAPAQALARLQTVGFFVAYAPLFMFARNFSARHYTSIIWGIYFLLAILIAGVGLKILALHLGTIGHWRHIKLFIPHRFWSYTLSLQQLSAINFFSQRVDVILVLNLGSLAILGQYVAIVSLADSIRIINRYITDTLLPSLTNMIAAKNYAGAADVFSMHMRILFLVNAATTFGFMFFAQPLLHIYGARYLSLSHLVVILAFLLGFSGPSRVSGALLSSVGKQQRAVWINLAQVALYVGLFFLLWPKWQLEGGVWAYGVSMLLSGPSLMMVSWRSVPFRLGVFKDYLMFCAVCSAAGLVLYLHPSFSIGSGTLAWIVAMGSFVLAGRYHFAECKRLLQCFLPLS